MSLSTNVSNLATAVATNAKAMKTLINGNAADLTALTTTNKTSLLAAINEIAAAVGGAGAAIVDTGTSGVSVWSSSKTDTAINAAVSALVATAPTTLDTLNELAAALADDPNFATTITNALALKAPLTSPTLVTPTIGVATATTVNKVAITAPATSATLTIAQGATLTASASATVSGTNTGDQSLAGLAPLASPTFTGTVGGLTKTTVGLANVDNTTDALKPISTAAASALALKAPLASPTFTGTVGGVTAAMVGLGSVENTSDASKPVSTAQASALALKAPLASPTFTGTVGGVTAAMVGLGSVNNTTDASKPISTAQAAVNSAQTTANGTFALAADMGSGVTDFVAAFNAGLV
jgi:hypothetical protein